MSDKQLKCIALDDEPLALDLIESHVNRHENLELIAKFSEPVEAIDQINELQPDLLFIDMQMPKLNGFEVISSLDTSPLVILTTAYENYALEAFEFDVFDYLLKPVTRERFDKSITKIIHHYSKSTIADSPEFNEDELFIKVNKSLVKLNINDILFIQGLQKYVKIYTTKGNFITLISMGKMIDQLTAYRFFSCHKSFLINIKYLDKIEGNLAFIEDHQIPIAKAKKQDLLKQIKLW